MKAETKRADVGEYLKLVTYSEALKRIEGAVSKIRPQVERVPIDSALGRVSAEDVDAPGDIPEIATSMMDGYAMRSDEIRNADPSHPVSFTVKGSLSPASLRPGERLSGLEAYYVATGAPIPLGADAVAKVEETRQSGDNVSVSLSVAKWKNIAQRGDDVQAGSPVVRQGQIVNAADIALLVAAGRSDLSIYRRPRVGVLSTGDELTRLGAGEEGKKVNNYANLMAAYVADAGALPVLLGIAGDDEAEIAERIDRGLGDVDAVITIGGSSVGTKDFTTRAIRRLSGCEELFHGVRLVPARPTGMFMVRGKPVVALPGHSVAAALAFFLIVHPTFNLMIGLKLQSRMVSIQARVSGEIPNPRPVGALFLVGLAVKDGVYYATPLRWGANLVSSLRAANAFLEVQPRTTLKEGEAIEVTLLGGSEALRIPGVGP